METNACEPTRAEIDALVGPAVVEFGATWCSHCQAAKPLVDAAFAGHSGIRLIWVEDGKGRPLGRTFGVKLWPTLIFLKNGQEVERLVRPSDADAIAQALSKIA